MDRGRGKSRPIRGEWFKDVIWRTGHTMLELGDSVSGVGWTERTIRRATQRNRISILLLDAIAERIDVHPDYLAGDFAWILELEGLNDEERRYLENVFLSPKRFPNMQKKREQLTHRRVFLDVLLLHDVDEKAFIKLDKTTQSRIMNRLDLLVTDYLNKTIGGAREARWLEYDLAMEWETEADVFEYLYDISEDTGHLPPVPDDEMNVEYIKYRKEKDQE